MVDFVSKEKRSKIMSSIRSKDTGIENELARLLKDAKIKYKRHPKMVGNPDFIIRDKKVAIFCDGDFWHGKNYKKRKGELPDFWKNKIETNIKRDRKTNRKLRKLGWKVVRLWEKDINNSPTKCINRVVSALED